MKPEKKAAIKVGGTTALVTGALALISFLSGLEVEVLMHICY